MEIVKGIEMKLNVKPVFVDFSHDYVYEGPCRFGQGDALTPEYDRLVNGEIFKGFVNSAKANVPDCVSLMEPVRVKNYTDEFIVHEADMEALLVPDETDVYLLTSSGRGCQVFLEFARRCKKPIVYYNDVLFAVTTDVASMRARNLEVYPLYDWGLGARIFRALYVRKVLASSRALLINRFSTDYSPVSAQDGFLSLEKVTQKLGFKFNVMDLHEYLDQLTVDRCEDNPTTPGRRQQNLTSEDMAAVEALTDELMAGAVECDMTRENVIPSVKAYYLTKKLLKYRGCNAFSAPCPDMCSTRRLNEERCTLCLTHSLLEEEGIPSACEIDLSVLICKMILESLTGQSTYMGNTCWLRIVDGKLTAPDFNSVLPEEFDAIKDIPNLAVTLHSVANRQLKGYNTPREEYALRSFAFSGWGATMRYDFSKDIDTDVTVMRIDPACEKMLVAHGKIKGQFGYRRQNCSTAVIYQVKDAKDFYEKTFDFGSHMALVYGDYVEDLKAVAQVLGLEVVLA